MTMRQKRKFRRIERKTKRIKTKLNKENKRLDEAIKELQKMRSHNTAQIEELEKELILAQWGLN